MNDSVLYVILVLSSAASSVNAIVISQSPDLYTILSGRVVSLLSLMYNFDTDDRRDQSAAIYTIRSSLALISEKAPAFDPRKGHQWQITKPAVALTNIDKDETDDIEEEAGKANVEEDENQDLIMRRALQTTLATMNFPS